MKKHPKPITASDVRKAQAREVEKQIKAPRPMILENNTDYSIPEARQELAEFLTGTIHPIGGYNFKPYKPNERDDMYWTVDMGNDWKVKFFADHPNRFEIIHRYDRGNENQVPALCGWLKHRLCAKEVVE